jgi:multiple sugar transport system substrate-binding protein
MNSAEHTKKFDRLLLILGLILLAVGILFALGRKGMGLQRDTVLVFTQWWQNELESGTLPSLVREFETLHPGITIQLDYRPYKEIRNSLQADSASSLKSDIIALDPLWFDELIRREILEPLDNYPEISGTGLSRRDPSGEAEPQAPTPTEPGFERWGLPLISFISPLFYNIELLQSTGFDRPPKTQAEMLSYARAVTDSGADRYGLALALSPENPQGIYRDLFSWIWASGPSMTKDGKPDFSAPGITRSLRFLKQLREEDLILPGTFTRTDAEKRDDFIRGRAAMMIGSVADIHILRERMGETDFGITVVPGEASYGGKPIMGLISWYLGIPRTAAHKDASWLFLSYLLEQGPHIAEKAHAVPGSRSNVIDFSTGDPLYAKAYDMYAAGETVYELTGVSRVDELEAIVRDQVYALFEKDLSPEKTAEEIQQRWKGL